MRRFIVAACVAVLMSCVGGIVQAETSKDAQTAIDKAIKALGGAEKLGKVKAATWTSKGKISFGGAESEMSTKVTVQGLDHYRQDFEGEFGGNAIKGITIVDGDKGWQKFGENGRELKDNALANQKRVLYLQAIGMFVVPLNDKGFKVEAVTEEKVGDKPAVALKAKGPDGKDFQIFFDKESGLPVKVVAKVAGRGGEENTQETTFAKYADFDGIQVATHVESTRDGEKFMEQDLANFKVVDKVEAGTFAEP